MASGKEMVVVNTVSYFRLLLGHFLFWCLRQFKQQQKSSRTDHLRWEILKDFKYFFGSAKKFFHWKTLREQSSFRIARSGECLFKLIQGVYHISCLMIKEPTISLDNRIHASTIIRFSLNVCVKIPCIKCNLFARLN